MKIVFFLEYLLIRLLGGLVNLLPLSLVFSFAHPVGTLIFWIHQKGRRRAIENLEKAFGPEKSPREIREIARESFVWLAEFAAGWLRMPEIAKNPGRYLSIQGEGLIHEALKDKKGAVILVSHAGNWEIMALIGGLLVARPVGATMRALARPLKNPYLYDYVIRLRGLTGVQSISKVGAVRETFRALRRNEIVCLLMDQRIEEGSVEADFFGRKALTTSLPAFAALRFGTPIFFGSFEQRPGPRFNVPLEGPLAIGKSGDFKKDVQSNTERFNARLEAEIRKDPGRWLWMHNRWRARDGEKD